MRTDHLLDADETILDFPRSSRESFAWAMERAGLPALAPAFEKFRAVNDALWKEYEKGTMPKARLVVERFVRFFAEQGVDADAAAANALYFGKLCKTGYLLPGAEDFLRALRARGKVYLITNGTPAAQYGRIDSLGIRGLFDGIFVSDEIGFAKPSVRFFEYVFAHAPTSRPQCVVIGDSLTSDIAGAKNAGVPGILYAPHGAPEGAKAADYIARSYAQILEILDTLN